MQPDDRELSTTAPYDCFMGTWEGVCKTFNTEGEFIEESQVQIQANWVFSDLWHFREHFSNLFEFGEVTFELDFQVTEKSCYASSDLLQIEGVQLTPTNYHFTIESQATQSIVYNTHYFITPEKRRVITHKIKNGKTYVFQIQDFIRTSITVEPTH
ncbi:MAG: hypothetical protein KME64_15195 [Scytonematopsis contorta HA4267-MV1]|jgi:hypothetical protein|nr:hypothetical protein [Scytonematopsis contorta HA4267-MV1]